MADERFLVCGSRPWNRATFDTHLADLRGEWSFVDAKDDLTDEALERLDPTAVFFLHWSWIVPADVVDRWECVVFHMTDVPYGRGGSPLQNLIARGHTSTVLTAMRMNAEVDAGPVYDKRPLDLSGTAEAVYLRADRLSAGMIAEWVEQRPESVAQEGDVVAFDRRTPDQSEIHDVTSLDELFDLVRMLDAEGYPRAFLRHGGARFELSRAARYDGEVRADVRITLDGAS